MNQLSATRVKEFTASGPGEYEIRLLLDDGSDKIAVRCSFTRAETTRAQAITTARAIVNRNTGPSLTRDNRPAAG